MIFSRINKSKHVFLVFFTTVICSTSIARIGDSKRTAEGRFKYKPIIYLKTQDGLEYATYSTGSFHITQYYLNGYCEHVRYSKAYKTGAEHEILMDELSEILKVETKGGSWETTKKPITTPFSMFSAKYAAFKHSNGTTMEISNTKKNIEFKSAKYYRHKDAIKKKQERERKKSINKF